jgi:hypothetical protein
VLGAAVTSSSFAWRNVAVRSLLLVVRCVFEDEWFREARPRCKVRMKGTMLQVEV